MLAVGSNWAQSGTRLGWDETTELLPSHPDVYDGLGASVSISGDVALVGNPGDSLNGIASGAAHVFERSGATWVEVATLRPSDGAPGDYFGGSVSLSGRTALIGADNDDDNGPESGSAYVFVQEGGVWTERTKLLPSDGMANDYYGSSVAVSGDVALVGAPSSYNNSYTTGSAYIFVRENGVWTEQVELLAADASSGDDFGESVSLSGDTALVGAPDSGDLEEGAAYVFSRQGPTWTQKAKLTASDGASSDGFGTSVSLSADRALIGAPDDNLTGFEEGSAYVFADDGGGWMERAKLTSSDGESFDYFGTSVAIVASSAIVGAYYDDEHGSASVFTESGGSWSEESKLWASDGEPGDAFGLSVSIAGGTALVGAVFHSHEGIESGSVYVFESDALGLAVAGSCPGTVTLTVSNALPGTEVGVIAGANTNGFTKGGRLCNGIRLEIGEPFQLPPVWIKVDGNGNGSGGMTLEPNRCWMEALAPADCSTSGAVPVP